jgi:hypothetical protein
MTVVYKQTEARKFTADEILWAKRELIDELVRSALVGQTEAFVDMIVDGQEDLSRAGIQDTLKGVKESANEFLADMLSDMQREVERRLEAALYGASVTGIKYDLAGEVTDVEVDVTVSFGD